MPDIPYSDPLPGDPLVVRVVKQFKRDLLAADASQMQAMAARWYQVEEALNAEMMALAMELDEKRLADIPVKRSEIYRLKRYRRLLSQVEGEFDQYTDWAEKMIAARQQELLPKGISDAIDAIKSSYAVHGIAGVSFDRLAVEAIESMVGLAGDGSPLKDLLMASYPEATAGLLDELVKGVALGRHPLKTARAMAKVLGGALSRMMNIARTEQLRVYREANRQAMIESGVVTHYKRLSAKDRRVCLACVLADGRLYQLADPFEDHPQGRCALIPVVRNLPIPTWELGEQWLIGQPKEIQIEIMGPGRYKAWQDGLFDLPDAITRVTNETWGASLVPTPLYKLVG